MTTFARQPIGSRDQASRLRDLVSSLRARDPHGGGQVSPEPARAHGPGPDSAPASPTPAIVPAPRPACPVVAITSGKGGVGKSCTAVNLAAALAQLGLGITLLDADAGLANADVLCGVAPKRRLDLSRLASADTDLLALDTPYGFELIPGAVGQLSASAEAVSRSTAHAVARCARRDLLIVDTGGGVGPEVRSFVLAADLAIVVATPEPTSLADAYALIKVLVKQSLARDAADAERCAADPENGGRPPVRLTLLVNQAAGVNEARRVHDRLNAVAARFLGCRIPMIGWVARDAQVVRSVRARTPFVESAPDAAASHHLRDLGRGVIEALNMLGGGSRSPDRG